jgi:uridine kinase
MQSVKPYFVGVSGGSASGKTYLLNQIMKRIPENQITLISQDNYYKKLEHQSRKSDGTVNFDHPDSIDLDKFTNDLQLLMEGKSFSIEEYTFNNPTITPRMLTYHPAPIVLVEGLFIFYQSNLFDLLNLKVFVDADEHIKLSRRIIRDYSERGYGLEEILKQYELDVIPMYNKFVRPYKESCDLIIPNNHHMNKALEVLLDHLQIRAAQNGRQE